MSTHTYCIFADDVRLESGNKNSIMGIYNRAMYIDAFPGGLSKLCVCVFISIPAKQRFENVKVRMSYGDKDVGRMDLPEKFIKSFWGDVDSALERKEISPEDRVTATVNGMISPFDIPAPGFFTVYVEIDGSESLAGKLCLVNAVHKPQQTS